MGKKEAVEEILRKILLPLLPRFLTRVCLSHHACQGLSIIELVAGKKKERRRKSAKTSGPITFLLSAPHSFRGGLAEESQPPSDA